jgi:hypothetical protein
MEKSRHEKNIKLSLHLTEHFALNIAGRGQGSEDTTPCYRLFYYGNRVLMCQVITRQALHVLVTIVAADKHKYYMFRVCVCSLRYLA